MGTNFENDDLSHLEAKHFPSHLLSSANFAALCAWIIASIFMAISSFLWFGQDFRGYYAAARVVLSGGNPYDYHQLAPVLLNVTGYVGNNPFYYPPWFAWCITPISWMPFEIARGIWMVFNLALWVIGLWLLSKLFDWPKVGWSRWLIYLLVTFIFAWITWRYEQTGILLFILLIGALLALQNKNWNWAGIWLALLLVKPNITFILVVTIVIWLIRHGNWQPVIVMCTLTIGLLFASTVTIPDWYQPFFQSDFGEGLSNVLDGPEVVVGIRINTTLNDWLQMFGVGDEIVNVIYALAIVIGIIVLITIILKSESLIQVTVVALLVSFAITPYALQYDYPPLTLVLFWATALYAHSKWVKIGKSAIILFIVSVPFWERPISDGYWIVVALIFLTILSSWSASKRETLNLTLM